MHKWAKPSAVHLSEMQNNAQQGLMMKHCYQPHLHSAGPRGCFHVLENLDQLLYAWRLIVVGPSVVGALCLQIHVQDPDQTLRTSDMVSLSHMLGAALSCVYL